MKQKLVKTISYYISGYGYGHAARSIAIIRAILRENEKVHIIICASYPMRFIQQSLINENNERIKFRDIETDIGYFLLEGSIEPDIHRLLIEYKRYMDSYEELSQNESVFLEREMVDLIISDISPLPFTAARRLGIPSIGISNFTWYTAYEGMIPVSELSMLEEAYRTMDHYCNLPGSNEPEWGQLSNRSIEFFCREVDVQHSQRIRQELLSYGKRFIVFFGLGMKVEMNTLRNLPIWDSEDCLFVVSSNMDLEGPNIVTIPQDFTESQNYIAASDLVITKPGWGTISEAIVLQKPLVIIHRGAMKEDRNMIDYLDTNYCSEVMSWDEFTGYTISSKHHITREISLQRTDPLSEFVQWITKLDGAAGV